MVTDPNNRAIVALQFRNAVEEIERLESDNLALREKVVELEKDKARLDWLDGAGRVAHFSDGWNSWVIGNTSKQYVSECVRCSIDKAMESSK